MTWNTWVSDAEKFAKENDLCLDWETEIVSGDLYIAKRNTGWKLLTCKEVKNDIVFPVESAYPYNYHECVKVVM